MKVTKDVAIIEAIGGSLVDKGTRMTAKQQALTSAGSADQLYLLDDSVKEKAGVLDILKQARLMENLEQARLMNAHSHISDNLLAGSWVSLVHPHAPFAWHVSLQA